MNIGNEKIESLHAIKLLGIEIDNKLNFNDHINIICTNVQITIVVDHLLTS